MHSSDIPSCKPKRQGSPWLASAECFSDIVHIDLIPIITVAVLIELEPNTVLAFMAVGVRFVNFSVCW